MLKKLYLSLPLMGYLQIKSKIILNKIHFLFVKSYLEKIQFVVSRFCFFKEVGRIFKKENVI